MNRANDVPLSDATIFMSIEFSQDHLSVTVDLETYQRLLQGTPFQQSMNLLALLLQMMEDTNKVMLDNPELTPKQREHLRKEFEQSYRNYLRLNPPPDIDAEALRLFCE